MSTPDISIDGLSVGQKLELMELIWADLSQSPEELPSPEWHGDVLANRRQAVLDGTAQFEDWDTVKERLLADSTTEYDAAFNVVSASSEMKFNQASAADATGCGLIEKAVR